MPESDPAAVCPECDGRGWVVAADGGAGSARPCLCRHADVVPRLVAASGVPPRYLGCNLGNFQVEQQGVRDQLLAARSVASRYVEEFLGPDGRRRESGLLFIGPPGAGKTHLATATLLEIVRRYRVRGRFVDFTSLIFQIQSTFDAATQETKQGVMEPVMSADLLVLDELGAQKPTPWVSEVLYLVLNTRYTRRLPTLFTTNYRLEDGAAGASLDRGAGPPARELLSHRIPAMLVSRLWEMARPVVIEAADFRQQVKSHQHA
ncbi:MAG TPA: ATP-binding protein [Thermoanaerobaculia bacterium]|nr:ATP-binding protein [Thermoanaerobaculia bacterium]